MNWQGFLESWRPGDVRGYTAEELETTPLPPELRRYYEVAGRLSTWNLHLIPPDELAVADDGRVSFIVEEQGVYSFSTISVGDDPPVWLCEDDHERKLGEPLSRFLLEYAIFEATGHGVGGWGYTRRDELPALFAALPPLPLDPWPHPSGMSLSFHGAEDMIALVFDSGESSVEVHVGARNAGILARLPSVISWDEDPLVG